MAAAPQTAEQFLELLSRSRLVASLELEAFQLQADPLPKTAAELARRLQEADLLTHFQARQLLQGKWRNFYLGKYKVLRPIGSGGMGRVLLCRHTALNRLVALKVLPLKTQADVAALKRFQREGRAVASLDHPNIVRAYDMGQEGPLFYLALEYFEGESLGQLLARHGPLPLSVAAECVRQAAQGLQHAHEAGWVHRDVKPDNLLLTRAGVVKILDLGLARSLFDPADHLTGAHDPQHILGTLDYLSPEQIQQSSEVDGRCDVYSLGATFYALLTGRPPFDEGVAAQKLLWHLMKDVRPIRSLRPDVPEELADALHRMLAKDPAHRFQEPIEVVRALSPFASPLSHEVDSLLGDCSDLESTSLSDVGFRLAERSPAVSDVSPTTARTPRPRAATNPSLTQSPHDPRLSLESAAPARPANGQPGNRHRRGWKAALALTVILFLLAGTVLAVGATLNLQSQGAFWLLSQPLSVPVISPEQAGQSVGKEVAVEMDVRSTGSSNSGTFYFLNSHDHFTDPKNFAIVVPRDVVERSKKIDPGEIKQWFLGKRIRVKGKVELFRQKEQIKIGDLAQVEVLPGNQH